MAEEQTLSMTEFVSKVVEDNGADRSRLTAILADVQQKYNYLPEQALRDIAEAMEVPLVDIYGVATFYTLFSLVPKGRHVVTVCMGTACHVRNSADLLQELSRELGIEPGQTSRDMSFTLETVNCLGACAMGPVMVVDGKYYGQMTASKVKKVLKPYRAEKVEEEAPSGRLVSAADLEKHRVGVREERYKDSTALALCSGTGCRAAISKEVATALREALRKNDLEDNVIPRETGCRGFCERGPILTVKPDNILYQRV
ncbi:MAG: NAD(P)H-dependent oxidoreductase subunit E, partial [bacterium]